MYPGAAGIALGGGLLGAGLVLPLTGIDLGMMMVLGGVLILSGLLLVRSAWRRSSLEP
jgi:hypothetical protein